MQKESIADGAPIDSSETAQREDIVETNDSGDE